MNNYGKVNPCCLKIRSNMELVTRQLANQSGERKKYEDIQKVSF